ncbi:SIS domain-containing protein [Photobacterium gaetbulicola]|uniref:Phosphoheptose isomerase n=2 Tax=Photobacterium gaetbulicola TaxID=1295392 RepID=A0A0C5X156_9GAMM|nr:D-sedoheptulose 7-phosphate isomerase [Photobacterium gaetbulicola]AJR09060.1 phosphoheptose isomerase [Photobacterium gaetbulicola Gung47]KHT64188.1 phosphoheptose isomerase [Photobacterium gaetbulicola]PSU04820.1 SIS domain-containing protein [Photobacterium gaetbulicola]
MEGMMYFRNSISQSIAVKQNLLDSPDVMATIAEVADLCLAAYQRGNKIILAGNGGSAADAQHIAAEFVSRFHFDRPGLPSLALTTDTSILTAVGNDYGFDKLFERQLQANGQPGDIFIGITTSGNSANVIKAMNHAREHGITAVGLAGQGGEIQYCSDLCIAVPSTDTARIQESHILIGHMICGYVEKEFFHGH